MAENQQALATLKYKVRGVTPEVLAALDPNQVIAALSRFSPEFPLIVPPPIYDAMLTMPKLEPFMNRVVKQSEIPSPPNSAP